MCLWFCGSVVLWCRCLTEMNCDELQLSLRVKAAVRRAGLKRLRDVLCVPVMDLQTLTGLSPKDVQQLLSTAAAAACTTPPITALQLQQDRCRSESSLRLSLGCPVLDSLLQGGLPVGGITELSGESGAGKTQLALQLCLSVQRPEQQGGLGSGVLYICTEDSFPIRRLQQLISERGSDVPSAAFTNQVYVEHAADLDSLQVCLSRRAPLLLARGLVRLLVVDSVAALFRCDFQAADWLQRNKYLLAFSSTLQHLSQEFQAPVLCINQVTDVFDQSHTWWGPSSSSVSPALGLAWANLVMVRLMMRRLHRVVSSGDQSSALRRLEVVFAPHLARDGRDAAVWREGVRGVS